MLNNPTTKYIKTSFTRHASQLLFLCLFYSSNLMKLLYCAMFLLRMSAQGPSTLSNLNTRQSQSVARPPPASPRPVQLDALQVGLRRDGGGPGPVQHQRDLPEVVRGPEVSHLLALLPLLPVLGHPGRPEHDQVSAGLSHQTVTINVFPK